MLVNESLKVDGGKVSDARRVDARHPAEVGCLVHQIMQVQIWRDRVEFCLRMESGRHVDRTSAHASLGRLSVDAELGAQQGSRKSECHAMSMENGKLTMLKL